MKPRATESSSVAESMTLKYSSNSTPLGGHTLAALRTLTKPASSANEAISRPAPAT